MKAIILSAGQGRRLLPLTRSSPKCLLPVEGDRTLLEVQLRALAECGVTNISVMVGFGADQVEALLASQPVPGLRTRTLYNPFFASSDNLVTCWLARSEMDRDFILLNGDSLFESAVLARLIETARAPLTLAINRKAEYDSDDMKVSLDGSVRLRAVSKTLEPEVVDGESIGLMMFRDSGIEAFRAALDLAVRSAIGMGAWYLSVVNGLADSLQIETACISGLWWGEVDSAEDLAEVRAVLEKRERKREEPVHLRPPTHRVGP